MQATTNLTTVLCLFHTSRQAQEALAELQSSQIPPDSISVLDGGSSAGAGSYTSRLQAMSLPERDQRLLSDGLSAGGSVIVVSGQESMTDKAEAIFSKHQARKIDQEVIGQTAPAPATPVAAVPVAAVPPAKPARSATTANAETVIPIVEEEIAVGKRQVQRGGVRVYSRIVETPVQESVTLREEHATIERHPVNRAVTEADMEALKVQSIEVTETAEVPVVGKSARVVEEVRVDKDVTERTEKVTDTVRHTEIEVEQLAGDVTGTQTSGTGTGVTGNRTKGAKGI